MPPNKSGTYILILHASRPFQAQIGKLGRLDGESGFYIYVGSAFGPGGLRARIGRHLQPTNRLHWHIDYLRQQLPIQTIWYCADTVRREHRWANALAESAMLSIPLAHFGSSDCRCPAHLFYSAVQPNPHLLEASILTIWQLPQESL